MARRINYTELSRLQSRRLIQLQEKNEKLTKSLASIIGYATAVIESENQSTHTDALALLLTCITESETL